MDPTGTDRAIRAHGLRRTIPRAVVARLLQANPGHHSVGAIQEIIDRDFSEAAGMARSSVYRALEALEAIGLVHSVRTSQEEVQFEWADEPHHHLICTDCGQVDEVSLVAVDDLEREVVRDHGFAAQVRHLSLKGTCQKCSSEASASLRIREHTRHSASDPADRPVSKEPQT